MNVKILGKAMVVTSAMKLADIKFLGKADKDALTIKDKEGNEIYKIQTGSASLSKFGASFDSANKDGFAEATIIIPDNVSAENRADWAKDNYAAALLALTVNEENFAQSATSLKTAYDTVTKDIKVL